MPSQIRMSYAYGIMLTRLLETTYTMYSAITYMAFSTACSAPNCSGRSNSQRAAAPRAIPAASPLTQIAEVVHAATNRDSMIVIRL
ncbi:hypothetical protein PCURB6_18350 [Paenibacillus curdlanolyticus]|nr:hypothetical protein PCURB6_18350 [Paenibacillus curdlanolyticus]